LDVQAINVQVVVTGPGGERVPGLSAKDFRILVDGQPASLDFFLEVRDGRAVNVQDPASGDAALPSALADVEAGDVVGNSYLVFIDDTYSPIHLRNEALKGLARDIRTLDPQDRVAVVTFDGRQLHVLSDWAEPGAELAKSIEAVSRSKRLLTGAYAGADTPVQGQLLEVYDNLYPTGDSITNIHYKLLGAQRSALAATAAQRAFAPTATGRKIMLFLSGGWPYDRYSMAGLDWETMKNLMGYQDDDGLSILRPLTDTGNLLGYTVYPLHLAETAILPSAGSRTNQFTGGGPDSTHAFIALNTGRNAMDFMAKETGGQLLLPGRNKNLSRIEEDTRSYYWLGFTHSGADDKRRDLKVEVLRPQLAARARGTFLPLSRPAKTSIEVESALITGKDLGAKPLEAGLGKLKRTGVIAAEVPLWVKIPTDQVSMVEQDGKYAARLELRVMSLDKNGGQSEVAVLPVQIDGENAPSEGGFVVYKTLLKVRNIDQDLQVALYDALSGENRMTRLRIDR
ncbi:MAG TPA: VWA domain-containing protein, partial [Thermoanaerobaculia bacterium]|nr:VWA domain-containing protein [Thermoanaerobaculia bacterium]